MNRRNGVKPERAETAYRSEGSLYFMVALRKIHAETGERLAHPWWVLVEDLRMHTVAPGSLRST